MEQQTATMGEMGLFKWAVLVGRGTKHAVLGFSEFVGKDIIITALDLKRVSVQKAADLVGGAEAEVVTIYLAITGGATGHIMLIYPPAVAFGLVDMLMDYPLGTTQELGEMEASALSEIGNITGSFFLNSLADNTGMRLMPSPPVVMVDMAGAILGVALADIMQDRDELFAMETAFNTADRQISGILLILPTADFLDIMLEQSKMLEERW